MRGWMWLAAAAALCGCAGGRSYPSGINHTYLCAVRVARANGYQVRAQEFKHGGGKLVAARSTPDPKGTTISRGWLKRTGEVVWNVWEHGRFEFWDEDLAAVRMRTEERMTASFRADRGFLGFWKKRETRIKVKLDVTDYGREDWVIRRTSPPADATEHLYRAMGDCLGFPSPAVQLAGGVPVSATSAAEPAAQPLPPSDPAPRDFSEALAAGRKAYETGDYAGTVNVLAPVADADPRNAEALGYLGAAYYQLQRRGEAIAIYERYVELVPSDLRTKEFLADIKRR